MKTLHRLLPFLAIILGASFLYPLLTDSAKREPILLEPEETANDWLFRQRAYPFGEIDMEAFREAAKYRQRKKQEQRQGATKDLYDVPWEFAGPINVGGRVTDVEKIPGTPSTIFVAAASGGIFRSQNDGQSWTPVFDDQATLSIGDMAVAPSNSDIMYVGTGEANAGGGSIAYDGLGVYRTTDGGDTWEPLGLDNVGSIGRVVVDPVDPDRAYVAAMGTLFSKNDERGVYRTTDGGDSWEQVLFVSDSTGAIDLVMHPDEPMTLYAAMWERVRTPIQRTYHGPTTGLYKSTDGGSTWTELTTDLPQFPFEKGRIGLAIAPSDPQRVYAAYANSTGYLEGVFRSSNAGSTWDELPLTDLQSVPYEWWFNRLIVSPDDPDRLFYMGFHPFEFDADNQVWARRFFGTHVDQHTLWIDPANSQNMLLGNDGGLYYTEDGGFTFTKWENLPITQFYTCEIDFLAPERLYGGTQDNGTNRTLTGALDDWTRINGGDGFRVLVDPTDNQKIYAESQYGNFRRSVNGGVQFIDALTGVAGDARKNWSTPVVFDPSNPSILYLGAERVYRTDNEALTWNPISPDLTNGPGGGNLVYGTITTLSVSPLDPETIWVGTDEGHIWVTDNGGTNWTEVSDGLPERWVTSVNADPNDPLGAIITYSGYRYGSNMSHIYRTNNLGGNWLSLNGNLPDIPVNDLKINPTTETLYLATDIGVFFSKDLGVNWDLLGEGLPSVVVTDLDLHLPTNQLIAATYGRSMWKVDISEEPLVTGGPEEGPFELLIHPNPVQNLVRIGFNISVPGRYSLRLFAANGQLVNQRDLGLLSVGERQVSWSLGTLPAGTYVLQMEGTGGSVVRKLVKG